MTTDPAITDADLHAPERWLEKRTIQELKNWLREAMWTSDVRPLTCSLDDFVSTLATIAETRNEREKSALLPQLRQVIPELLREWGPNERGEPLIELVQLAGRLRCADAEPILAAIARGRLQDHPDPDLPPNVLNTLLGFDVGPGTLDAFSPYLDVPSCAAIAFRKLCVDDPDFDIRRAFSQLVTATGKLGEKAQLGHIMLTVAALIGPRSPMGKRREELVAALLSGTQPEDCKLVLQVFSRLNIALYPSTALDPAESEAFGIESDQLKIDTDIIVDEDMELSKVVSLLAYSSCCGASDLMPAVGP